MLCSLSSRSVNDVVSDSIYWIVSQRKAFAGAFLFLCICCAVIVWGVAESHTSLVDGKSSGDGLRLWPMLMSYTSGGSPEIRMMYSLLAFLTSMLAVPLIVRYFIERRWLKGMGVEKYLEAFKGCFARALAVSALVTLSVYVTLSTSLWITILVVPLVMTVAPMLINGHVDFDAVREKKKMAMLVMLMTAFVVWVVQMAPSMLADVFIRLFVILSELKIGFSSSELLPEVIYSYILAWMLYVNFCVSIAILLVSSTLLGGTLVAAKAQNHD